MDSQRRFGERRLADDDQLDRLSCLHSGDQGTGQTLTHSIYSQVACLQATPTKVFTDSTEITNAPDLSVNTSTVLVRRHAHG